MQVSQWLVYRHRLFWLYGMFLKSRDPYRIRRPLTHALPPRPVDLTYTFKPEVPYTFKPEVCRDFLHGRCTYGNKCRRIHIHPPPSLITTVSSSPLISDVIFRSVTSDRKTCKWSINEAFRSTTHQQRYQQVAETRTMYQLHSESVS